MVDIEITALIARGAGEGAQDVHLLAARTRADVEASPDSWRRTCGSALAGAKEPLGAFGQVAFTLSTAAVDAALAPSAPVAARPLASSRPGPQPPVAGPDGSPLRLVVDDLAPGWLDPFTFFSDRAAIATLVTTLLSLALRLDGGGARGAGERAALGRAVAARVSDPDARTLGQVLDSPLRDPEDVHVWALTSWSRGLVARSAIWAALISNDSADVERLARERHGRAIALTLAQPLALPDPTRDRAVLSDREIEALCLQEVMRACAGAKPEPSPALLPWEVGGIDRTATQSPGARALVVGTVVESAKQLSGQEAYVPVVRLGVPDGQLLLDPDQLVHHRASQTGWAPVRIVMPVGGGRTKIAYPHPGGTREATVDERALVAVGSCGDGDPSPASARAGGALWSLGQRAVVSGSTSGFEAVMSGQVRAIDLHVVTDDGAPARRGMGVLAGMSINEVDVVPLVVRRAGAESLQGCATSAQVRIVAFVRGGEAVVVGYTGASGAELRATVDPACLRPHHYTGAPTHQEDGFTVGDLLDVGVSADVSQASRAERAVVLKRGRRDFALPKALTDVPVRRPRGVATSSGPSWVITGYLVAIDPYAATATLALVADERPPVVNDSLVTHRVVVPLDALQRASRTTSQAAGMELDLVPDEG